jgi:BCD family chlorophyll transporter-like MFS transporter
MNPMSREERAAPRPRFADALDDLALQPGMLRMIGVVALGTAAFAMQDVLLEPYGGEILGLPVAATTALTAVWAMGALAGFALAAKRLGGGADPFRVAALGILAGIVAFSAVIFSAPMESVALFFAGAGLIGFGAGLFSVSMLTAVIRAPRRGLVESGLALGAWGAAQATATGVAVALGGGLRDLVGSWALDGAFGPGMATAFVGYSFVYHLEIGLLFLTLVAIGPLVRARRPLAQAGSFGLSEFPT